MEQNETGEMSGSDEVIQVDPVIALAETTMVILNALLPLVPLQVAPGDLEAQRKLQEITTGMQNLHSLLLALGSQIVQPTEEAKPSSNIILPR